MLAELGYARTASGDSQGARETLRDLDTLARRRYVDPFLIAVIYFRLGERDTGFAYPEKAYTMRPSTMPWVQAEPRLDAVRTDPRYIDLPQRLGFLPYIKLEAIRDRTACNGPIRFFTK